MFYYLVSKIPYLDRLSQGEKIFRVFLVGSICYIILHGFLYSTRFSNNETIQKYRKYIFYAAGIDATLTLAYIKFTTPATIANDTTKTNGKGNAYIERESEGESDSESDTESVSVSVDKTKPQVVMPPGIVPGMTREQVIEKIKEHQMNLVKQAAGKNSPFIKKDASESLAECVSMPKSSPGSARENSEKSSKSKHSVKTGENNMPEHNNSRDAGDFEEDDATELISDTDFEEYKRQQAQITMNL